MPLLTKDQIEESKSNQMPGSAEPVSPYGAMATVTGVIPGTEKLKDPFPKEQKDAVDFSIRMENDMAVMDRMVKSGLDPVNLYDMTIEGAPFIPDFLENMAISAKYQVFRNAARDFAMAKLRRETGAQITAGEMEDARQNYIPSLGDGPMELAEKRKRMELATQNMIISAGGAYDIAKKRMKKSDKSDLTEEEAADILRERAKKDPALRAKLQAAGVL